MFGGRQKLKHQLQIHTNSFILYLTFIVFRLLDQKDSSNKNYCFLGGSFFKFELHMSHILQHKSIGLSFTVLEYGSKLYVGQCLTFLKRLRTKINDDPDKPSKYGKILSHTTFHRPVCHYEIRFS